MITGLFFYILLLVPIVYPKASSCGVLQVVAAKLLSNGNDLISHAFVQTDAELHYFRDVSSQDVAFVNRSPEKSNSPAEFELQFEPNQLEFEKTFLGSPKRLPVTIHNPNSQPAVIHAISSKSLDFYFSFPEDKVIKPQQHSKFTVTFLPRNEGESSTVLSIHTSLGIFLYKVVAHANGNPYRIRPSVKARLPINGTFEFPILLHNPHPEKLRLVSAFSSHSELFLMHKRSNIQLEIAPFETVNIAQVVAMGGTERNLTVFIIIKLDFMPYNDQVNTQEIQLVMAVDLDVTSKRGIFSTSDVLDFGLIKYGERSKRLVFKAYSTVEKGLEVDSVYVDKSNVFTNGIYMQFFSKPPISVKCKSRSQPGSPVSIANVEIDTSFLSLNKSEKIHHVTGEIVAESRGGNYNATIRFQAVIFIGEILHTSKDAAFHRETNPPARKSVSLQNNYPFGLAVWNITIPKEAQKHFKVELIRPVVEIAPNKTNPVLLINYIEKAREDFTTICTLYTNVTTFEFSIFIFHGGIKINVHSLGPFTENFGFGLIKPGTRRSVFFKILNRNPVIITLRNLENPLPDYAIIEPISINHTTRGDGPQTIGNKVPIFDWGHGSDFPLFAHSVTVFNFSLILPPTAKVVKELTLKFETDYKIYELPIIYELTNSTIRFVENIIDLGDTFPGKISSKDIRVHSSFDEDLRVLGLAVLNKDPRFYFKLKPKSEMVIKSHSISSFGQVRFSQSLACTTSCYTGFPLHTADGQWFNYGLKLPQNLAEIDSYLYSRLRRRFEAIEDKKVRSTIILDTEKSRSFDAVVETKLVWPRLFSHPVIHFPLTAVGNFTILNLTLTNPSIHPVIVQLLPLVIYPDAESVLEFFREEFSFPIDAPVEMNETLMWSLRDTELFTLRPGSPVPKMREELEKIIGGSVPRFTLSMILQPGMNVRVRIGFLPSDYTLRSSLLLIRNNLTAIEPIILYGKGAHINMEIDGKVSRNDYLLFDILPTHLSDCHNPKRLTHKLPTTLTVKRSFAVKNTGEVKFTVMNIAISGTPCRDRGFRVLNCKPFSLAPNETHSLEIAYTPDFLMSINEATLQLTHHMNATPWMYDMVATVSAEMLPICHAALPRPSFEWVLYYSCMFSLIFCMICVVAVAYLEGDRFITTMTQQQIEALGEKDLPQSKPETNDVQPDPEPKKPNIFYRLLYGPRDQTYLYALEFGTGPISNIVEKCCNYVIWICANILLVIRGEAVRGSSSKRNNKRNKRRFAATGFHVQHHHVEPIKEVLNARKSSDNSVSSSPAFKEKLIGSSQSKPINFSDSMSSTKSHEGSVKSSTEPNQGVRKRKNVTKKYSDESQPESLQSIEVKPIEIKIKPKAQKEETKVETAEVSQKIENSIQQSHATIEVSQQEENNIVTLTIPEVKLDKDESSEFSDLSPIEQIEQTEQIGLSGLDIQSNIEELTNQKEDEKIEFSDSSAVPEWADDKIEEIGQGNLNDEFDEMVKHSSTLFPSARATSAMSNSSHSTRLSQSDNIQPSSSVEDSKKRNKRRTKKKKVENTINPSMKWLTRKEINRLTNEYKLQLEAMANMRQGPQILPQFMPPPQFMPNPSGNFMPTQFMQPGQPDYYNEFMRLQLQYQNEQEIQRQVFNNQRPHIQGSPIPWSQGQPPPSNKFGESSSSNNSKPLKPLPTASNQPTTDNSPFSPLTSDLFSDLDTEILSSQSIEPMRASSSFFDSLQQLTNIDTDDPNNQFLSLYSSNDHIWQPIEETNKNSLWPNMDDSELKKKEE